jgi:hypothetical protein
MSGDAPLQEPFGMIRAFVEAPNLVAKMEYVRQHPALLSAEVIRVFGLFTEQMRKTDADFRETLEAHRAVLDRAREVGLERAFDEFSTLVMAQRLQDFMDCYSWMDSYVYLQKHPELASDQALGQLSIMKDQASSAGNREKVKIIDTHGYLLHQVMRVGAEAAFVEVGGADFLNSRPPAES